MVEIYPILQVVLLAILVPVGVYVAWKIDKKYGISEFIELHEHLATIAVKMVAVTYDTLSGPEKLDKAVEALSEMLADRGIKLSPDEIRGLAQDAYDKWVQEWKELEPEDQKVALRIAGKYK